MGFGQGISTIHTGTTEECFSVFFCNFCHMLRCFLRDHLYNTSTHGMRGLCQKMDKCGHGEGVFKLQWTSTNGTIILTFETVYSCLTCIFE